MKNEKKINVAFQGAPGAYSDQAIKGYFRGAAESVPCHTFYDVVELVRSRKVDYGMMPVENSIIGPITHSYDLLLETKINVVGEFILPIHHCLIGLKKTKMDKVKRIYSHYAALAQCEVFLRKFTQAEILPVYDTAGSVKMIKEENLSDTVAVAGADCAKLYGLDIIEENIEDYPHNQTRFLIVAANETSKREECHIYKTTIVFDTLNQPGLLYRCLGVFDKHNINLTFLESRPHKTEPWRYHFFADMLGHQSDPNLTNAIEEMNQHTDFIHVFGSYPRWSEGLPEKPQKQAGKNKKEQDPNAPLFSKARHPKPTKIKVGSHVIGGGDFVVMAGPCGVEGRHQLMETARFVKAAGAHILRGGAYKPRSSPYSFQGLKEEGLKLLKEAREEFGLPIITEVISPETLPLVAETADILQIGARNMQNFALLTEVGKLNKPVMLKRGMMATLKELLLSAEYILEKGNPNVILCERGIRTFETATRNTLDLSAVPLLKEQTHLPVFVDPSHGTGVRSLVIPMVKAAIVIGADGVMVETHLSPSTALSDGAQSLDAKQFGDLMREVAKMKHALGQ